MITFNLVVQLGLLPVNLIVTTLKSFWWNEIKDLIVRIKMHIFKAKLPFYPPCEVKYKLQNGVSTVETFSPWREKPQDKLRIILLYQIEITTLRDTTWVKKTSLFLFTHYSLPHCIFSFPLSIFLFFFFACAHSCSSTRLHFSPQSHLWDFSLFTFLQMAE